MAKRYQIEKPDDLLTEDVIRSLKVIFRWVDLPLNECWVRLPGGQWQETRLAQQQTSNAFCGYLRENEPFASVCLQYRIRFCDEVMNTPQRQKLGWCPFGLGTLGTGFQVGGAQVVLFAGGWTERGNEGLAYTLAEQKIESLGAAQLRDDILSRLADQDSQTDAKVASETEGLHGLVDLIKLQAQTQYERNLERSQEQFIQDLSSRVYPLMVQSEQERSQVLQEALNDIAGFFSLRAAGYCFSTEDSAQPPVALFTGASKRSQVMDATVRALLFPGKPVEIGIDDQLTLGEAERLLGAPGVGCRLLLPGKISSLLAVRADEDGDSKLDKTMLSRLVRTLSLPLSVALLGSDVQRAARLRWLQALNVAHTVRSTFQAVVGDVEAIRIGLRKAPGLPQQVQGQLQHLEELVTYMSATLASHDYIYNPRAALDLRRRQLEKIEIKSLREIIERAAKSFCGRADDSRIDIVLERSLGEIPDVPVDVKSISLVFLHLLDNAIKYSHRGTSIKRRTINVSAKQTPNSVYIEVADFGLGIHPLDAQRVFEPFSQGVTEDVTRPIHGQGLGLAAAQSIARLHGGDVRLVRCTPYLGENNPVSWDIVKGDPPGSKRANEILQHCLVIFEVELLKHGV